MFLDYLIEEPVQAVIVGGRGVLVNVPQPARFALHKLWTAGQRPPAEQAKVRKDRRQAAALLEVLLEDRPGDVSRAWKPLRRRSAGRLIRESLDHLPEPLAARIKKLR